jgi:hypothetical protein
MGDWLVDATGNSCPDDDTRERCSGWGIGWLMQLAGVGSGPNVRPGGCVSWILEVGTSDGPQRAALQGDEMAHGARR